MADSKHSNDTNLDTFLEDIFAKHLNFPQSDHEVQVVQQLVHEMVNNIVTEAYSSDSSLTVREIIPVGSMAENTRVMQPDEFDFMIVLDKFHADDVTWFYTGLKGTLVRLKPKCRRENCAHAMKKLGPDYYTTTPSGDCDCKSALLVEEMKTSILIRQVVYKMIGDCHFWSVESFPGRLRVVDDSTSINGPAITFDLSWETYGVSGQLETMKISIDLVLALELEINSFYLHHLDIFDQNYYERLRDTNKVHLLQRVHLTDDMFQVSFALTETQIIRDERETHGKCYMLLKYFFRTRKRISPDITSYTLKNLVLQHAVQCEGGGLGCCLLKILVDLRNILDIERSESFFIPQTFSTKKNLLYNDNKDGWLNKHREDLSVFMNYLEKIRDESPASSSIEQLLMSLISHYNGPFFQPTLLNQVLHIRGPNSTIVIP